MEKLVSSVIEGNPEAARNAVKVMVGGATVTPEWALEIGADAYGEDAINAARKAKQLVKG